MPIQLSAIAAVASSTQALFLEIRTLTFFGKQNADPGVEIASILDRLGPPIAFAGLQQPSKVQRFGLDGSLDMSM